MPKEISKQNLRRLLQKQYDALIDAIDSQMIEDADNVITGLYASVSNWDGPPDFDAEYELTPKYRLVTIKPVGRNARKFIYVDRGTGKAGGWRTQDYPIEPKGDYPLRFQRDYNPKTQAVALANVGDGRRSGDWVSKYKVMHPGITPRLFTEAIVEEVIVNDFQKRYHKRMKREVGKVKP